MKMGTTTTKHLVAVFVLLCAYLCSADDGGQACYYTSGSVAGIVIATVVVTIVVGCLTAAAVWYLWKQKTALVGGEKKKPGSVFFGTTEKGCSLEHHPSEKHALEGGKEAYAFDNPYFKDDEGDLAKKLPNQDAAEKGESGYREDNGEIKNSTNKINFGQKPKKNRPFSNITFPNVFHQSSKKPRAMDDTFIPKPLERIEVPLRGHDFTGLGFNICGNMRDGIFVKDVLHRGPASESGKIKAGDRIVGVRVSFSGMVYEDALTILSYASPYDVHLELEKTAEADRGRHLALPASSPATKSRLGSSSFRTGQRLFHPLYRSQSFDDLTQIGKDNNFRIGNSPDSAPHGPKTPSANCPKRSQSIETATTPKTRVQLLPPDYEKKGSRNSSASSAGSSNKRIEPIKTPEEPLPKVKAESPKIKSARFHVENFLRQKKAPPDISPVSVVNGTGIKESPKVDISPDNKTTITPVREIQINPDEPTTAETTVEEEVFITKAENHQGEDSRPAVPPRKSGAHGKRKAPAPPVNDADTTETSAIVHRDADDDGGSENDQINSSQEDSESETRKEDITYGKIEKVSILGKENDVHSVSGESLNASSENNESSSTTKRKASSLGDLTKLDANGHMKSPTATTILERAVSLDLQQQPLPEGNLVKQKMILRAPTFEDAEDANEEDFGNHTREKKSPGNLQKWEGTWDKLREETIEISEPDSSKISNVWTVSSKTITNGHSEDIPSLEERSTLIPYEVTNVEVHDTELHVHNNSNSIRITSTPLKKAIETESFIKNDVDLDDIPFLGDFSAIKDDQSSINTLPVANSVAISNSRSLNSPNATSPISLSIPIIKPNFSQYEKLPSPLSVGSKQAIEPLSPTEGNRNDSDNQPNQEQASSRDTSNNTSYEPVFSSETASILKSTPPPVPNSNEEFPCNNKSDLSSTKILSTLDIVNGNGLGLSSYSRCRTTSEDEDTSVPETTSSSILEVSSSLDSTTKDFSSKKPAISEISSIKVHSGAAGFAKTLIISTPIEGESISLNADLDSPPPQLEPPQ